MESIAKVEKIIAAEGPAPGDYEKDGLLYCGKCHTPKEFRGSFLGMVKVVPCLCRCRSEKLAAEEQQRKAEKRQARSIAVPAFLKAICRIGTLQLMTVRIRA